MRRLCAMRIPFWPNAPHGIHGSEGTLYSVTDWDKIQSVRGAKDGEGLPHELPIPDEIWGKARRDTIHNTYRDVFRQEGHMIGDFIEEVVPEKQFVLILLQGPMFSVSLMQHY